jgi:hypothetical protein
MIWLLAEAHTVLGFEHGLRTPIFRQEVNPD